MFYILLLILQELIFVKTFRLAQRGEFLDRIFNYQDGNNYHWSAAHADTSDERDPQGEEKRYNHLKHVSRKVPILCSNQYLGLYLI